MNEQFQLPDNFSYVSYTDRHAALQVNDAYKAYMEILNKDGSQIPLHVGPYPIKLSAGATVSNYVCVGDKKSMTAMYSVNTDGFEKKIDIKEISAIG